MKTRYPSRIDWWIGLPLLGVPVLCFLGGIVSLFFLVPLAIVLLMVGVFMGLSVAALSYPCAYILDEDALEIRKGLGEERVAYRDILSVEPLTSVWAAEALSVYRVRIDCASSSFVISPKEREQFIRDLSARVARAKQPSEPQATATAANA